MSIFRKVYILGDSQEAFYKIEDGRASETHFKSSTYFPNFSHRYIVI